MQFEQQRIPYHATDMTGKRILVLAPHPDDETIGCGGSVALHRAADDPVKVVFLTDGAQGDFSGRFDKETYIKLRRTEARKACACLDVNDIEFWPYADRHLGVSQDVLQRLGDLFQAYRPELVYVPSPFEMHPDHCAATQIMQTFIQSTDYCFQVAFMEIGQPVIVNCLIDITPVLDRKVRAMEAYETQLLERSYKEIGLALNRFRSLTLPAAASHAEGFSVWSAAEIRNKEIVPLILSAIRHCSAGNKQGVKPQRKAKPAQVERLKRKCLRSLEQVRSHRVYKIYYKIKERLGC